jgi:hypothetical protein
MNPVRTRHTQAQEVCCLPGPLLPFFGHWSLKGVCTSGLFHLGDPRWLPTHTVCICVSVLSSVL